MIIRPINGKHVVTVRGITVSCSTFSEALRTGWMIATGGKAQLH